MQCRDVLPLHINLQSIANERKVTSGFDDCATLGNWILFGPLTRYNTAGDMLIPAPLIILKSTYTAPARNQRATQSTVVPLNPLLGTTQPYKVTNWGAKKEFELQTAHTKPCKMPQAHFTDIVNLSAVLLSLQPWVCCLMPGRGRKQQVVRGGYLRPPILHDGKAAELKPM